jgi:hypothetical protein
MPDIEYEIPITLRGRTYGYITWRKRNDPEMDQFIGKFKTLDIEIAGILLRRKPIDRKQRRISLGYTITESLDPNHTTLQITALKPGTLRVTTK